MKNFIKTKVKRSKMKTNIFVVLFRIVSVAIILVCLYILYDWHLDNKANNDIQEEMTKFIVTSESPEIDIDDPYVSIVDEEDTPISQFDIDFDALVTENPDCVGWIRINDTNISYPIVQANDNDYYLTHNVNKQKNGAGSIFADYRNDFIHLDQNTIIYGHNRRNGSMFSNLKFYLDTDFCADENHQYFNFYTTHKKYLAEIFSIYKITSTKVSIEPNYENSELFKEALETWKSKSIYDFNKEVSETDNVITLYTCDNNTSYRIIIHAKLIPIQ